MQKKTGKRILASCIRDGCGKQFDKSIPETRDSKTLRPFWQRYCPEHRVTGETYKPIIEVPAKPAKKRILSVTVRRMFDESPDTSYLGEYSNRPTDDYAIDRATDEFQADIDAGLDWLERVESRLEDLRNDTWNVCGHDYVEEHCPQCSEYKSLGESQDLLRDLRAGEPFEVSWNNREYRYFVPNSDNYKGLPVEDIRKYCLQDYKRIERLNAGDWCYLGIRADAEIIPNVQSDGQSKWHGVCQKITSGGLWGIESDSDRSYFEEVEQEELSNLREELLSLGFSRRAISTAFRNVEHKEE